MSYTIVVSDSNGLHTLPKYKVSSKYTEHRCPNDMDIKVLYNENSVSQFYNEIVSKLMLRNVRGRVILYFDDKDMSAEYILNLHKKLEKKPSWAALARKITTDDSKRMSVDRRHRLNNELKRAEQKINAVLSPPSFYNYDGYDSMDEYHDIQEYEYQ
jgi:hypothetical protein